MGLNIETGPSLLDASRAAGLYMLTSLTADDSNQPKPARI